jgi:hypothetical protein
MQLWSNGFGWHKNCLSTWCWQACWSSGMEAFRVFVREKSSTLVLTNVFCSPAGLWTAPREPCKFFFHFHDLSLVVTLAQCWNVLVLSRIRDKSNSTLNFRYSGIHLWTNQYLIHQQLFSFMASLGAGKTGVNGQCSICACNLPSCIGAFHILLWVCTWATNLDTFMFCLWTMLLTNYLSVKVLLQWGWLRNSQCGRSLYL